VIPVIPTFYLPERSHTAMSKMSNLAFIKKAIEHALVAGFAAFAASGVFTGGVPSVKALIAGLTAGGIAALYAFVKAVGAVQALKEAAPKS
jgi:hypothetical protein